MLAICIAVAFFVVLIVVARAPLYYRLPLCLLLFPFFRYVLRDNVIESVVFTIVCFIIIAILNAAFQKLDRARDFKARQHHQVQQ